MNLGRALCLAACAALIAVAPAAAQSRAVLDQGRNIAMSRCGVCHAVGSALESPHRIAPPFAKLHERFPVEMLSTAFRTGVVSGHDEMPMFEFSRSEIDALLAYIDSLGPAGGPAYARPRPR